MRGREQRRERKVERDREIRRETGGREICRRGGGARLRCGGCVGWGPRIIIK